MRPNDMSAFPRPLPDGTWPPDEIIGIIERHAGMTLRDYFAAKAMQAALAGAALPGLPEGDQEALNAVRLMSKAVYVIADAMLEARQ